MRKLINELKKLELLDIKSALMLLVTALPALILKMRKKNIWLIAERVTGAEDNGWIFYQWMRKNHPERNVYFILLKGISKFDENDDHMIGWATLRHYMYYQASRVHIKATFVPPRPTQRVCSYYESYIKKNIIRIYLRHGISVSGIEQHRYEVQKVRMFVCGAKPEYDYIRQSAGYPEGYVQYTGLARYDDLLEKQSDGPIENNRDDIFYPLCSQIHSVTFDLSLRISALSLSFPLTCQRRNRFKHKNNRKYRHRSREKKLEVMVNLYI